MTRVENLPTHASGEKVSILDKRQAGDRRAVTGSDHLRAKAWLSRQHADKE